MNFYKTLATQTVEELLKAGYPADYIDYGFAFDRAVNSLHCKNVIDLFTDIDWELFDVEFNKKVNLTI